jgi:starch synthase (maltosyl-transferring)
VHPELGTIEDFDRFVATARGLGLDVALDFAIQCSPDHPYVKAHPEWFFHRPDGSIKYAENPPKKYQDVYPVNFYTDDPASLWAEMKRVVDFWVAHGVTAFRVDNPHTKPVPFWEWLIREVQREHPEIVFLAEAFTRPKMMKALAKAGFTQSYTYFTWRNDKRELTDYIEDITSPPVAEYFRGNLWPNCTPRSRAAADPPSSCGSCSRPRCRRSTASTRATSCSRTCPRGRIPRSI